MPTYILGLLGAVVAGVSVNAAPVPLLCWCNEYGGAAKEFSTLLCGKGASFMPSRSP